MGRTHAQTMVAARKEAEEEAKRLMGPAIDVDPMDALLWCVRIAAGEVAYLTWKLESLTEEEIIVQEMTIEKREAYGEHAESYDQETVSNKADLSIWIRARQGALDRLAKFSKMALDAGIDERRLALAEDAGDQLSSMLREVLEGLELTPAQEQRAPEIVRGALEKLERSQRPLAIDPA